MILPVILKTRSNSHKLNSYVNRVTPEVVKEASKYLKDNKTDPIYVFSSDSVKPSPDVLFEKLATAFK
jgi:hypothetical protein